MVTLDEVLHRSLQRKPRLEAKMALGPAQVGMMAAVRQRDGRARRRTNFSLVPGTTAPIASDASA